MSTTWNCGPKGPKNVDDLRNVMKEKIRNKKGKALIAEKFTKDHIFCGHSGNDLQLATKLSRLRDVSMSTLLISSFDLSANKEVLNWIDKIPANKLTRTGMIWKISAMNSTVGMLNSYKFVTVDFEALKNMDRDDMRKKARKYMKSSFKTPKLACQFAADGTPQIYHLDY